MHRQASLADLDAVYSIYMDKDVIPYLGFDPMPRVDFSKVMDELVASESFFVASKAGEPSEESRVTFETEETDGRDGQTGCDARLASARQRHGKGIAKGWLLVLSSMKSFLETGQSMDL